MRKPISSRSARPRQGLVTAVRVARGDRVVKGQPLFEQDDADDRAAVDQARRLLQQARGQLANLQVAGEGERDRPGRGQSERRRGGARPGAGRPRPQRAAAQDRLGHAADRRPGGRDLALGGGEGRRLQRRRSRQLRAPMGRPSEIAAQTAMVDALEAALKQAQWRLDQRSVTAPEAGRDRRRASPFPARRSRPARRSSRCCRRGTSSSASSSPSRSSRRIHVGDTVAFSCDDCPPDLAGDGFVHLAAARNIRRRSSIRESTRAQVRLSGGGAAAAGSGDAPQSRRAGRRVATAAPPPARDGERAMTDSSSTSTACARASAPSRSSRA